MPAEYSTSADQTIQPGASALFDLSPAPCREGLIYHRDGSALFRLASPSVLNCGVRNSCCCRFPVASYDVSFHGNVALPATGTVADPVSLALSLDGEIDPGSYMFAPFSETEVFANVGAGIVADVPWLCRCGTIALRNTSTQPVILRAGATLKFDFDGVQ